LEEGQVTIMFAGELTPIDEVVCILLSSSRKPTAEEKIDETFRWLERRLKVGQFEPKGDNMTIANELRKSRGKIMVPMLTPNDSPFVVAEKAALIEWARGCGDDELEMTVVTDEHGTYLTTCVP
jgi:hypothetical protein